MTVRGGGVPCHAMAFVPPLRMGSTTSELAADAHACIMVRVTAIHPPDTRLRRESIVPQQRAPLGRVIPDHNKRADVLGAVKARPGND
jgi:hypothetical protein